MGYRVPLPVPVPFPFNQFETMRNCTCVNHENIIPGSHICLGSAECIAPYLSFVARRMSILIFIIIEHR